MHTDYVLTNIVDLNALEPGSLACTSCKSKENAMSRCNDCANFLCASCDNAHKYMRCFENHKVVLLNELRDSTEKVVIHKPLFCFAHPSENLKYYCFNCHVPVCNDCLVADHKGADHHYELIADAEKHVRPDIEVLVQTAKAKVAFCDTAALNLGNSLTELQSQHDAARETIEDNYKKFKIILEKCREKALKDLESLHSERELNIMDSLHNVEESVQRIENTCKFTGKVLQQANGAEFLSLKQLISNQIHHLINSTPKTDLSYSLEFDSKYEKFEVLAQDTFGKFRTESSQCPKESTPPPTLPGMPPSSLNKSNGTCSSSQGALTGSVTASSPVSLPTSMQSSFDGDMLGHNFMMQNNVLSPDSQHMLNNAMGSGSNNSSGVVGGGPGGVGSIRSVSSQNLPSGLTNGGDGGGNVVGGNNMSVVPSMLEYNLSRLASIHCGVNGNSGVGGGVNGVGGGHDDIHSDVLSQTSNQGGSSQFTLADLISGDQRAINSGLQALAKFGMNSNGEFIIFFITKL